MLLLLRLLLDAAAVGLMLLARGPGLARRLVEQRFVGHKFVAVPLQDGAGEGAPSHPENTLFLLLQFFNQSDEIAVPADDGKGIDMIVRESHLESVERQIDIGAVLVAAGRRI